MRNILLAPETKAKCVTFAHKGTTIPQMAEKAASKRVDKVVIHDTVPPLDAPPMVKAISKKMVQKPGFIHICTTPVVADAITIRSEKELKEVLN